MGLGRFVAAVAGNFSVRQKGEGYSGQEGGAVAATTEDLTAPDVVARYEGENGFFEVADPLRRVKRAPTAAEQILRTVVAIHTQVGRVDVDVVAVRIGQGKTFIGKIQSLGQIAEADREMELRGTSWLRAGG